MLHNATRYRVRQTEDRPLRIIEHERLSWRYLYFRSAESFANLAPSQDFLTFQHADDTFVFAVCDGVGQSFFGDVASRLLGDLLTDWLCSPAMRAEISEADVRASLGDLLRHATERATLEVAAVEVPFDTPRLVKEVLNDKRKLGSESTFVCARVDLPTPDMPAGRLIAAWMGNSRMRAWGSTRELTALLPADSFQVDERWSTRDGPVMGEPHILIAPLLSVDGRSDVTGLMAYTDGLIELDTLPESPTDADLTRLAVGSRRGGASDDITFIEVRLQGRPSAPEPSSPDMVPISAPSAPKRVRARQTRKLLRDPVVLASLVGIVVVLAVFASQYFTFDLFKPPTWSPRSLNSDDAVVAAYNHYWDVVQRSYHSVSEDPDLRQVATGNDLNLTRAILRDHHDANYTINGTHTPNVVAVASRGDEAIVTDRGQADFKGVPPPSPVPGVEKPKEIPSPTTFVLVNEGGQWKVTFAQ